MKSRKQTEKRADLVRQLNTIIDEAEKRGDFTDDDQAKYDRVAAEIREIDGTVDMRRFNGALAHIGVGETDESSALLTREQRMQDWHRSRTGATSGDVDEREDFNIARFLRGVIQPETRSAMSEYEQRAVVVGTSADGGVLFPEVWSTKLIDVARNKARLFEAGASTLPMSQTKVHLPRLTAGVTPGWRGEGDALTEDTGTFDMVELEAKFLAVVVRSRSRRSKTQRRRRPP